MKQVIISTLLFLMALVGDAAGQNESNRAITVTENIAYRTDVGPSTVR